MTAVTLLLPSLSLLQGPDLRDRAGEFPRLARLLGRARSMACPGPFEPRLFESLGLPPTTGLAALTAGVDFPDAPLPERLLRCDPLHLHADPAKVLVQGRLTLREEEAGLLIETLCGEFPELGFRVGREPSRWYVSPPADFAGDAPSLQWLHGRSLTPFMPQGPEARAWRRTLNDVQMVLHAHPINMARLARGELPVNGVWFFGAGVLPHRLSAPRIFVGADVLLAGLARATGQAWTASLRLEELPRGGHAIAIFGTGFGALAPQRRPPDLDELEERLLPPLQQALFTGRLRQLVVLCAGHRLRLDWRDGLRVWRTPQRFVLE